MVRVCGVEILVASDCVRDSATRAGFVIRMLFVKLLELHFGVSSQIVYVPTE